MPSYRGLLKGYDDAYAADGSDSSDDELYGTASFSIDFGQGRAQKRQKRDSSK